MQRREPDEFVEPSKTEHVVQQLEENRKPILRWLGIGIVTLNLIFASIVLWFVVVPSFV